MESKAVWTLFADVICLNYDGNVFDAALLAIIAALKNGNTAVFIFFGFDTHQLPI